MLVQTLRTLFARELGKLKTEIEQYTNEGQIWALGGNIANTAGNLCLHLVGNLNTFIGAQLGNTGYIRNRELEFSLKGVARTELIQKIEDTIKVVDETLAGMPDEKLQEEYPLMVFGDKMTTGYFLTHLAMHLSYHLGQVNYHRRLLDK
jgi:hypothetical protein